MAGGLDGARSAKGAETRKGKGDGSLFAVRHWLYVAELVCTAAFMALLLALGAAVSWWAALGAFGAFVLGMVFTTLAHARRDVHFAMKDTAE